MSIKDLKKLTRPRNLSASSGKSMNPGTPGKVTNGRSVLEKFLATNSYIFSRVYNDQLDLYKLPAGK